MLWPQLLWWEREDDPQSSSGPPSWFPLGVTISSRQLALNTLSLRLQAQFQHGGHPISHTRWMPYKHRLKQVLLGALGSPLPFAVWTQGRFKHMQLANVRSWASKSNSDPCTASADQGPMVPPRHTEQGVCQQEMGTGQSPAVNSSWVSTTGQALEGLTCRRWQ